MGVLDDDEDDGLAQTLAARSEPYRGLAAALLRGTADLGSPAASTGPSQRDVLLAMQNPNLQSPSAAVPDVAPVHVPTLAPAGIAQTMPVAASKPGRTVPSSGDDKAALSYSIESRRPDLGLEGDLIRGLLRPGFTRDLFDNYWQGGGQGMQLNGPRFKDIADHASALKPMRVSQVTGPDGGILEARSYSFYGLPDYKRSLGRATLFYDQSGKPVGFYDDYDLDPSTPHHPRDRSRVAEAETRIMNALGRLHGAHGFPVYYGEYAVPVQ